jgi:EXPERA (EXPanded EBP superfamily)
MPVPLRDRRGDWFFIAVFAVFTCTSLVIDTMPLLGWTMVKDAIAVTYADCDPLFVALPPFLWVAATVSGFVWGPLYLYFIWGFVRGDNRIRLPAVFYSGALTLAMAMIFAEELWSPVPGWASPQPGKFLAYNLPYWVVPMLLGWRMRSPYPFGGDRPG